MKISRLTDRYVIKMGEISLKLAPLSGRQKVEMTSLYTQDPATGRFKVDKPAQEHYMVKQSIKEISGLKDDDGNDYKLEFDGDVLTETCAEEVLGFLVNTYFTTANVQAIAGLYGEVISPLTNKPIKGVSVERYIKEGVSEGKPDSLDSISLKTDSPN